MLETKIEAHLSQAEVAAAERVQKKSAIALSRLALLKHLLRACAIVPLYQCAAQHFLPRIPHVLVPIYFL